MDSHNKKVVADIEHLTVEAALAHISFIRRRLRSPERLRHVDMLVADVKRRRIPSVRLSKLARESDAIREIEETIFRAYKICLKAGQYKSP